MAPANGETNIKVNELTTDTALEAIFDALTELQEAVDEIKLQQAEIVEKLSNLSLDNDGYSTED